MRVVDWLPFVKSNPVEDGGDPTPRWMCPCFNQTDGEVFREVMVALSDAERSFYVEWLSRFEIDPKYEEQLVD
jgi:hypothetical protein